MTIVRFVLWSDLHPIALPTFCMWVADRSFHPLKGTCHVVSAGTAADLLSVHVHDQVHKHSPVAPGYPAARFFACAGHHSVTVANSTRH